MNDEVTSLACLRKHLVSHTGEIGFFYFIFSSDFTDGEDFCILE